MQTTTNISLFCSNINKVCSDKEVWKHYSFAIETQVDDEIINLVKGFSHLCAYTHDKVIEKKTVLIINFGFQMNKIRV